MRVLQSRRKRPLDVLAIGTNGTVAAACSQFGVRADVEVWTVASGGDSHTLPDVDRDVFSITFSPDGQYLFVGREHFVAVCDAATGARVADLVSQYQHPEAALSADGTRILVTANGGAGCTVTCHATWGGSRFRQLWDVESGDLFSDPCFSPDGSRAAVSVHESRGDRVRNRVHVLDAESGALKARIEFDRDGSEPIEQVAFSADGEEVLARARSRTVKLFDAATGQPAGELVHPGRPFVTGMAVHPGGMLACSRNNGTVCFWDVGKRELVRTLDWKLGRLASVAFAPDGTLGAAGTEDGRVIVWDVDE
jgi:WD40 repeat protein